MPVYEYACSSCGAKFDTLRSMKDADKIIECAKCHSVQTRRIPSVFFSKTVRGSSTASTSGCSGCSGGSCSTCGH